MAILDVKPLFLKNVELVIGGETGNDFRKHVSGVTFTPSSSTVTWTGLGLNTHTDANTATWTCDLTFVQDWTSTTSLSRFLYENEGDTVPVEFRPISGEGPTFEAEIVITPGAIGGTVGAASESTVSLGCNGKPTLVPAA